MIERVTIKYNGIKHEIPISDLDLIPGSSTDQDVLTAVAQNLGIPALSEFEVDRYETVWNVRPEAVHGMDITESNFEVEVIQSDLPIVVDCYTQWCSPCKALKPLLTEVVNDTDGKVRLGFLDIEDNPNLAERFQITSVPKVLIFKDGKEMTEMLGVYPKERYQEAIEAAM